MRRLITLAFSLADEHTVTLYDLGLKLASYLIVTALAALCVTMPMAVIRKVRALLSDEGDASTEPLPA
jgi:hypothetical protein